jgi:hypothetical protein
LIRFRYLANNASIHDCYAIADLRGGEATTIFSIVYRSIEMRRLILHVGPMKTASTYLQYRLFNARERMAALSIEYPEFGMFDAKHSRIAEHLLGNAAAAGDITDAKLVSQLERFPNVLLSCEAFAYMRPQQLLRLKSALQGFSIEIVFYYRSLVHLLPSHWQEYVKQGVDATFIEYLSNFAGWSNTLGFLPSDVEGQLMTLSNVFGRDSLRIICFDNVVEQGLDVFEHFWTKVLRLPAPAPAAAVSQVALNMSATPETIDVLRNLNESYFERTGHRPQPAAQISEAYRRNKSAIETAPGFLAYREAFSRHTQQILLTSTQDLLRARERVFLSRFGDRIENKAESDRMFIRDKMDCKVPTAPRFWPDRSGMRGYINELYDKLVSPRAGS